MSARRVRRNAWGNLNGYVGKRRVIEFGTRRDDDPDVLAWLARDDAPRVSAQTVDVLAVMQYAANEMDALMYRAATPAIPDVTEPGEGFWREEIVHADSRDAHAQLIEARAAVADAVADLKQARAALNQNATFPADVALDRIAIAAALARIGGAK